MTKSDLINALAEKEGLDVVQYSAVEAAFG